ncbi:hypothetical protein [Enterococcus canintestini]|uniref:Uncharacterized protein n=1 Tax=Enterococcus canintestini TaxID=317010 RepID=A0A267HPX4_9ENTE|nr:hypothetical protein [Enterococcus canintestini]PAB00394.1 hypothetical protein AKL21_09540 [Enterococcus canintestini]
MAKINRVPLSLVLGVSNRTLEKWRVGYSMLQGSTKVVIDRLYEDYDLNIKPILKLNPVPIKD